MGSSRALSLVFVVAVLSVGCSASDDGGSSTPSSADSGPTDTGGSEDSSTVEDGAAESDAGGSDNSSTVEDSAAESDTGSSEDSSPVEDGATEIDSGTSTDTGSDTGPTDGGSDASVDSGPPSTDNTTGKQCTSDADCNPTGLGLGHCTNGIYVVGPLNPTAVCRGIDYGGDACDPSDDTTIRFCDGPDYIGLCSESPATCDPMCQVAADGTVLQACVGKNACNPIYFAHAADGSIVLIGTCEGGCVTDGDCPSGSKCEPTQKICVKTCTTDSNCKTGWPSAPANWKCDTARGACHFSYPKSVGDVCTTSSECPCLKRASDADGICTVVCKTGSVDGSIPAAYVCDPLLPATDTSGNPLWSFTTIPAGLSGYAMKKCSTNADCAFPGLTTEWTCQASPGVEGGKTCQPKP